MARGGKAPSFDKRSRNDDDRFCKDTLIAISQLERYFAGRPNDANLLPKRKRIIPTYGTDLKAAADACRRTRADTAPVVGLRTI